MKRYVSILGVLLFVFSFSENANALTNKMVYGPEDAVVLDRSCVLYWQADEQLALFCAIFYSQNSEAFIQFVRGYNPTKSQGLLQGVNWMQLETWSVIDLGGTNTVREPCVLVMDKLDNDEVRVSYLHDLSEEGLMSNSLICHPVQGTCEIEDY